MALPLVAVDGLPALGFAVLVREIRGHSRVQRMVDELRDDDALEAADDDDS